jgi:hypothetical protein
VDLVRAWEMLVIFILWVSGKEGNRGKACPRWAGVARYHVRKMQLKESIDGYNVAGR